jgi:hypothetical protein
MQEALLGANVLSGFQDIFLHCKNYTLVTVL